MNKEILKKDKQIMVIVDANAFVHSSFHGYSPKLDIKGQDHRIMHGLLDTLVGLTYQLDRIDQLFMIFDPEDGDLFRTAQYPSYKKNRPPNDPELKKQRDSAKFIFKEKLGIPSVHYPGYEADDIIGSLAKLVGSEYQVVIVSPDKDIAQLVDENIFMLRRWKTKTEKGYSLMNNQKIKEEFGVNSTQIPDWLALMGDTADNLPGIKNVGKKTASNILANYPSLEHLLSVVNHIEDEKLKNKILEVKDSLPLIKKLATIVTDLPISKSVEDAINYGNNVRNNKDYKQNILKLEKYFNWKVHYKELFL